MATIDDQAYITTVVNNSYQYFNTELKGLVFKDTDSTYSGITGTNSGQTLVWEGEGSNASWVVKSMAETSGGFNYQDQSFNGIVYNSGSTFYSIDMSANSNVNAVQWVDGAVTLVSMNALHTIDLSSMATGESYVIRTDGAGNYTVNAVPVLPGNADTLAKVYVGGADSATFAVATPENLMGLSATGSQIVVAAPATSTWSSLALPAQPESGTEFYHLSATSTGYEYVKVLDSLSANGINIAEDANIATTKNIGETATALTTAPSTNFTAGLNYDFDVTFDIYVNDIIALADGSSGAELISKLPIITLAIAGGENLGTYRIKPNQPIQTIHLSHVVYDVENAPVINVSVSNAGGLPGTLEADFIQYIPASLSATMVPCGTQASA